MMRTLPFVFLVAWTGCGGGRFAPPVEYAALFQPHAAWSFTVEETDDHHDDQDPNASADGNVHTSSTAEASCRVVATRQYRGGVMSQIKCTGFEHASMDPLTGLWVADRKGLYMVSTSDLPAGAPDVDDGNRLFDAVPKESASSSIEITHEGDAWCHRWTVMRSEESWSTLCIDGVGPVRAEFGRTGDGSHEMKTTRK